MSIPILFIENPVLHSVDVESPHYDGTIDFQKMAVGDMCYYHYQGKPVMDLEYLAKMNLTAYYFAHNKNRPPLILALPDTASPGRALYFLVDGQCYSGKCTKCGKSSYKNTCGEGKCVPRGYYDGWTVNGPPPNITVNPSVNYDNDDPPTKHYHGFVQNGVIGPG